ncbi:adenylyltransferase/cytidyltransferase family protein [Pseudomonas syringae]|nr:adenylyltransferase/cytidyltransferase family protein [Pseudomonas syringae]
MHEIALYGGAFNPPHAGHARVMIEASRQTRKVMVMPSFRHPDGKCMADYAVRLQWLRSIVAHVQKDCAADICVSDTEQHLAAQQPGPIYSYTLLDHMARCLGIADHALALVVGPDVLQQLPRFYRGRELLERFAVICIDEQIGVRSSTLRERLINGEPVPPHWMAPGMNPLNYGLYAAHGH